MASGTPPLSVIERGGGETHALVPLRMGVLLIVQHLARSRSGHFQGEPCGRESADAASILLGGNHEEIRKFRKKMAREKTERLRPDLLS